jgi:hypothetical protein
MAFAQLTYRDGLRDIEACLRSLGGKLYHMGFHGRVSRSTLADANDTHDWRILRISLRCSFESRGRCICLIRSVWS